MNVILEGMKMKKKMKSNPPNDPREQALRSPIFMKQRGTPEWCYQKVAFLRDLMRYMELTVKQWDDAVEDLKAFHAWEKIPEGQPYGSLQALLKAEVGVDSERAVKIEKAG